MEYFYELRIPKDRVAVLIGKKGETKEKLEENTSCQIRVNSKEGEVFLKGKDALQLYSARQMVTAIGRGFNPEVALLLLNTDYVFEVIDITIFSKKSKDTLIRLKGRVIGKEGKSRRIIEELSECHISIYGKTISMIGSSDTVGIARQAIESLLKGSTHANVYKFLEKRRREFKRSRIIGKNIELK